MKTKIAVIDDNNFLIKSVKDKLLFFDEIESFSVAFPARTL